jgi:comEA protein
MQARVRRLLTVVAMAAAIAVAGPGHGAEGDQRIDINAASASELATLPGIGEAKAKAIIEHRTVEPFRTVDDLKKVKGIGDKTFESLRPQLTVGAGSAQP